MTQLSADPVFQLNTVLWMLQPSPPFPHAVDAVLYRAGYSVRQLSGRLTASDAVELTLAEKFGLRGGVPAPDVLMLVAVEDDTADAPDADPRLVFECKASSFGPDSSTADQARKFLGRAVDLSLAVGAAPGKTMAGAVVYLTRDGETTALQQTLTALAAEFDEREVPAAPASALGVTIEQGEGVVVALAGGTLPGRAAEVLAEPCVVVPAAGDEEMLARCISFRTTRRWSKPLRSGSGASAFCLSVPVRISPRRSGGRRRRPPLLLTGRKSFPTPRMACPPTGAIRRRATRQLVRRSVS